MKIPVCLNNIIESGAENNKEVKKGWWDKLKDKLGWSEEEFHNTFKDIVEIIWDELSDKTRTKFGKRVDNRKKKPESTNESEEYTLYDQLVEEYLDGVDFYDIDDEQYDNIIFEMRKHEPSIMSREDFLTRYYY